MSSERSLDLAPTEDGEWLETDGLGGFASGTTLGVNTRPYHALVVAALAPPAGRLGELIERGIGRSPPPTAARSSTPPGRSSPVTCGAPGTASGSTPTDCSLPVHPASSSRGWTPRWASE